MMAPLPNFFSISAVVDSRTLSRSSPVVPGVNLLGNALRLGHARSLASFFRRRWYPNTRSTVNTVAQIVARSADAGRTRPGRDAAAWRTAGAGGAGKGEAAGPVTKVRAGRRLSTGAARPPRSLHGAEASAAATALRLTSSLAPGKSEPLGARAERGRKPHPHGADGLSRLGAAGARDTRSRRPRRRSRARGAPPLPSASRTRPETAPTPGSSSTSDETPSTSCLTGMA